MNNHNKHCNNNSKSRLVDSKIIVDVFCLKYYFFLLCLLEGINALHSEAVALLTATAMLQMPSTQGTSALKRMKERDRFWK